MSNNIRLVVEKFTKERKVYRRIQILSKLVKKFLVQGEQNLVKLWQLKKSQVCNMHMGKEGKRRKRSARAILHRRMKITEKIPSLKMTQSMFI